MQFSVNQEEVLRANIIKEQLPLWMDKVGEVARYGNWHHAAETATRLLTDERRLSKLPLLTRDHVASTIIEFWHVAERNLSSYPVRSKTTLAFALADTRAHFTKKMKSPSPA